MLHRTSVVRQKKHLSLTKHPQQLNFFQKHFTGSIFYSRPFRRLMTSIYVVILNIVTLPLPFCCSCLQQINGKTETEIKCRQICKIYIVWIESFSIFLCMFRVQTDWHPIVGETGKLLMTLLANLQQQADKSTLHGMQRSAINLPQSKTFTICYYEHCYYCYADCQAATNTHPSNHISMQFQVLYSRSLPFMLANNNGFYLCFNL